MTSSGATLRYPTLPAESSTGRTCRPSARSVPCPPARPPWPPSASAAWSGPSPSAPPLTTTTTTTDEESTARRSHRYLLAFDVSVLEKRAAHHGAAPALGDGHGLPRQRTLVHHACATWRDDWVTDRDRDRDMERSQGLPSPLTTSPSASTTSPTPPHRITSHRIIMV